MILVVVVLVIASFAAYEFLVPPPPAIQVGFLDVWAPDNVCGLNSNPISYYGYNSSTNSAVSLELSVPNYNATSCTVVGVSTNTSGFSLSDAQIPVSIPGNGNASMNLTITSPGSSYSGDVNLVFS